MRKTTNKRLEQSVAIPMKAIEEYFARADLFITLNKVVEAFTSEDESLVSDHSNESH